jgi:hypothetical protein
VFKRLSAALLAGPLLIGLMPIAASAAPTEPAYRRSADHRPGDHYRCIYRCVERFGHDDARHDDGWGRERWGRERWGRDRRDRDRYDRRRYDPCRYGRCDDRIYHEGKCWYLDGDRWRRCRSRDRRWDRYHYRYAY